MVGIGCCRVCKLFPRSFAYQFGTAVLFHLLCSVRGQSYKSGKILCRTIVAETQQTVDLANDFDNLSPGSSLISMLQSRKQCIELFTRTTS